MQVYMHAPTPAKTIDPEGDGHECCNPLMLESGIQGLQSALAMGIRLEPHQDIKRKCL